MVPCGNLQDVFPKSESFFSNFTRSIPSETYNLNHFIVLSDSPIALDFFADQLIQFQVTTLFQIYLKRYLLRNTNTDLLSDYLENLVVSYIICLHPIEKHMSGH